MVGKSATNQATQRVVRTLYRSCLRWTRQPAVVQAKFQCGNLPAELAALDLPLELLTNRDGVREGIRLVFRQDATLTCPKAIAERIDLGLTTVRYLNELSKTLEEVGRRREENRNRTGIDFRVGQVVRHKVYCYRGVILGWDRRPVVDVSKWSAVADLPSKDRQPFYHVIPDDSDLAHFIGGTTRLMYCAQENLELAPVLESRVQNSAIPSCFEYFDEALGAFVPQERVTHQYPADVMVWRDAATAAAAASGAGGSGSRRRSRHSSSSSLVQEAKVVDASRRLESLVQKLCTGVLADLEAKYGPLRVYKPPVRDIVDSLATLREGFPPMGHSHSKRPLGGGRSASSSSSSSSSGLSGSYGGRSREKSSLNGQPSPSPSPSSSSLRSPLYSTSPRRGVGFGEGGGRGQSSFFSPMQKQLQLQQASVHPGLAKTYAGYRALGVMHELFRGSEDLWHRRLLSKNREGVLYSVGQVVRHKEENYRGVVSGWERPGELLSLRDGNVPKAPPSYRLIVHEADRAALERREEAGPRSSVTLIAQKELVETCESDAALVVNPLIPGSFEYFDPQIGRYYPNATLRFMFPLDFLPKEAKGPEEKEHDGKAEKIISTVVKNLRKLVDLKRNGDKFKSDLLLLLRYAKKKTDATVVEGLLWHCWLAHPDEHVRALMDDGLHRLASGHLDEAVARFDEVVEQDPQFAEAYNVRGRAHYLAGRYQDSLEDINRTLTLEPQHFGAMLGKGLSYYHLNKNEQAVKALLATLRIHPWSTGVGTTLQHARKRMAESSSGSPR